MNELVEAADEKVLAKTIARYGRVDLLCIDELGYMELDRRGAELLFQATARAQLGLACAETLEETALALAATVVRVASDKRSTTSVSAQHEQRITRTLRHLCANVDQRHTLTDLAKLANLSPYHFLRTFKAVTGVTPHQWLLRTRLRDAAWRLSETREPVTGIALQTGFEDLSNFIRSFRAEFGLSPQRYRAAA